MKTKLLKRIRDNHPIHFDTLIKKYKYRTINGEVRGGEWYYDFESDWESDWKSFLGIRRELIIKDASAYFFKTRFCYKRKRPTRIYRYI
jgi:hypothetical protein